MVKCCIIDTGASEITGKNSIDFKWAANQVLHKLICSSMVKSIKPLACQKLNIIQTSLYLACS